ncbi:MAG: response regulator [Alphaproteobacteria bacterium]|nr:response regulator [Alphaproteobacteria bacterium]
MKHLPPASGSSSLSPEMIQTQKLESLGQLAGGVAHDFNNILSIIDGYARIAKKESGNNPDVITYLDRISDSVKRGSGLTRKLLAFGRHNIAVVSPHDLGQLVEDMEVLLRPLLDVTYTLQLDTARHIMIDTAPDWIGQILMNLCVNARDSMREGGVITLRVKLSDDSLHAYLEVSDKGCGIDESVRARIFDPFFTTKERGKGTGLGLSTVYGLVQQMKGSIDVETAMGKGTTFRITLPLSEKSVRRNLSSTPFQAESVRFEGYVALVAEDEPDLLLLLSQMLEETGMTVLKATNGNEALVVQEEYEGHIDFLLTDVVMPQMNGVELSRLSSALRPDTHIIFMSGYPAGGQMARVDIPPGSLLLPKPVSYDVLKGLLYRLIVQTSDEDGSGLYRMAGGGIQLVDG